MNKDYLYSILNLYLNRETNEKKTVLNISRKEEEIEFSFTMNIEDDEQTKFVVPLDVYRDTITDFVKDYKEELMIIDEKYSYNNDNGSCNYRILFKNGRILSFNGFAVLDMNNIRNLLYDIKINSEEMRVSNIDEKKEMVYKPRQTLQQAGFSSFASLFLIVLFFADVLVIALWIFKAIFK